MGKKDKESYLGGVESYEGDVPIWMILVFTALIAWGIYWLFEYWRG